MTTELIVTLIVTSITAMSAIAAPIATAAINARSSVKLKRFEHVDKQLNARLNEFAEAFSNYNSNSQSISLRNAVVSAAYKLLAVSPSDPLCELIRCFLESFQTGDRSFGSETEQLFRQILIIFSEHTRQLLR